MGCPSASTLCLVIILVGESGDLRFAAKLVSSPRVTQVSVPTSDDDQPHNPSRSTLVGSHFTIRPFTSIAEFKECVRFQEETWGEGFSGPPRKMIT